MSHDIFISYSRRDLAAVKPIKEELERLGFSCWMDLEGIESGSPEFTEKIAEAVGGSTAVLFFLSEASQASHWSLNELRLARRKGKHIVLVRFNGDPMHDKFMLEFGGTDVIDWRADEQKAKLIRDLARWKTGPSDADPSGPAVAPISFPQSLACRLDRELPWDEFRLVNGIEFRDDTGAVSMAGHVIGSRWGLFLVGYNEPRRTHGRGRDCFVVPEAGEFTGKGAKIPSEDLIRQFADFIENRCELPPRSVRFLFAVPDREARRPGLPDWVVSEKEALDRIRKYRMAIPVLDWDRHGRTITRSLELLPATQEGLEANVLKHFKAKTPAEVKDGAVLLARVEDPSDVLLDAAELAFLFLRENGDLHAAEGVRCWIRVMADRGNVLAMDHYGWLLDGSDEERAEWFRKGAELGGAHAQNSLGYCLHEGKGAQQDRDEALRWFRASAAQGNRFGQESLARAFAEPDFAGLPQDWNEAFRLYRLSAEQGWHWSQYHLGECYEKGLGTQRNLQEARRWYEKAAEQLNAEAQSALKRISQEQ